MIKRILCIFMVSIVASNLYAQSSSRPLGSYYNLEKYWFYRYRLINDFMKIGSGCGESLPFAERIATRYNRTYTPGWGLDIYSFNAGGEVPIHLGDYIGVLATEHRLLSNNGFNTNRTEYELNLALGAFERLDKNAEYYTQNMYDANYYDTTSCPILNEPSLNGYFIRDDVPYTRFIPENLQHLNRPGSLTKLKSGINHTQSALDRYEKLNPAYPSEYWYKPGWEHICVPHEESKDGTINLSMGFALTSRLLGSHALSLKARGNLQRMVEYIHDGSKLGSPGGPHQPWTIVNPITEECVYGDEDGNNCDKGGGRYRECAYGAAEANQKWGLMRPGLTSAALVYRNLYNLSQYVISGKLGNDYNFWGNFAALCNNWYVLGALILPTGIVNTTWLRMKQFAIAKNEGQPHLPYLYRVMNPGRGSWFMSEQTRIKLDVAPPCGPHNYYGNISNGIDYSTGLYQFNGPYAYHWSGPNIIHSYYSRQEGYVSGAISATPRDNHTDFNGIDYMLLFNLYSLQDFYLLRMFNSYYKENFNLNFPDKVGSPYETGSYHRQLKLNFLEYVSAINKVYPDGYFSMRCAKAIDLKPGFEAQTGSKFLAYIEDYHIDCGDKEAHRPSEEYHYAEINQKPGWIYEPNSMLPQNQSDTTYFLDFPPDGVPYVPDSSAYATEDEDSVSCEDQWAYIDSLITTIYASGDLEQIDYLDSLLPYISIPECDSSYTGSYMSPSGGTVGGNNSFENNFSTNEARREAFIKKLIAKGNNGLSFNVYPNPNNGHFTVAFADVGNYDLRLINAQGVVVFKTHVYSRRSEIIHLDGLPPGVYILELLNPEYNLPPQTKNVIIRAN